MREIKHELHPAKEDKIAVVKDFDEIMEDRGGGHVDSDLVALAAQWNELAAETENLLSWNGLIHKSTQQSLLVLCDAPNYYQTESITTRHTEWQAALH